MTAFVKLLLRTLTGYERSSAAEGWSPVLIVVVRWLGATSYPTDWKLVRRNVLELIILIVVNL